MVLSPEQLEYQQILRQFLTKEWPRGTAHKAVNGTVDTAGIWRRLSGELDVAGVGVAEEHGGLGMTQVEVSLVAEELGRALYTGPWFATVALAVNALTVADDRTAMKTHLPALASGARTATVAFADRRPRGSEVSVTTAEQTSDGWVLHGLKDHVVDGSTADLILVTAQTTQGLSLFALEGDRSDHRVTITALKPLDPTRPVSRLEFSNTPAALIGEVGGFDLQQMIDLASVAATAEAVGGSAACIDTTVAHVLSRTQFGRPIGSFQAVKHRLADMQVRLDSSRAALRYLAQAVDTEPANLSTLAAVAKTYVTRSYFRTAADTIQLHGGIGFTWEHVAHLHFKRAKSLELMLGSHNDDRRRIADGLLGPASV